MRKILFILILVLLLVATGLVIYKGIDISIFNVWGIPSIQEENDVIDEKNEELAGLVGVTYPNTISRLESSSEKMEQAKKEYEDQAILLKSSRYYRQTEEYKIEFLWTRIGNYAKDNKVEIKIDVTNSETNGIYNLNFTATGKYANIAQFIYDIENDSRLGFKIEDFNMKAVAYTSTKIGDDGKEVTTTTNTVQGTFSCKDIRIDLKSIDKSSSVVPQENNNTTSNNQTQNAGANTTAQNQSTSNTATNTTNQTTNSTTTNATSQDTNNTTNTATQNANNNASATTTSDNTVNSPQTENTDTQASQNNTQTEVKTD